MKRSWFGRVLTAQRLLFIRDVSIIVTLAMVVVLMIQLSDLASQNRERHKVNSEALRAASQALVILEEATSEQARAEQQKQLTTIILTVDCNNQQTLQRTVDVLVERGVLAEGDLEVITEECEALAGPNEGESE